MRLYKRKKIWLNRKNKNFCWIRLYAAKKDMQAFYLKDCENYSKEYEPILGAHIPYEVLLKGKLTKETGLVLLCFEHAGFGLVAHEILHAVLWARGHKRHKKQYPIVIKNMEEEEDLLHDFTYAVRQFYIWYWKIEKQFKKLGK